MRFFNLSIIVSMLFSFSAHSQIIVQGKQIMNLSPKGEIEIDTFKQTSEEASDGIHPELKFPKIDAKKANQVNRYLGFKTSVGEYLKDIDSKKIDKDTILRVANNFRLNNQTVEAEYWYNNVITKDSKAKDILHYAQVLQINGKCEDAIRWNKQFKKIASRKEKKNREIVIDCKELKNIKNHETVKLKNVRALNTGHLDFSPIPYQDGVIFSSTRKNATHTKTVDKKNKDNFSDLYYAEFDNKLKRYKRPKALKGDLNKNFHEGVATFDQSGTTMLFTRNNNIGKSRNKNGLVDLKVYSAVLSNDGLWAEVTELPFNSNEFTSCHPTLSLDGKRLYFASNRPGGYGGLDIYVSKKEEGIWQTPQNLGPIVNSAGNEIFPVMQNDETLYYASNGHQGIGGLDIFYTKKTNLEDEYSWSVRENLGTPFNSLKDDFSFVIMENDNQTGFLTSNREGGKGKDDIYTWSMDGALKKESPLRKMICVFDKKTDEKISNVSITISEIITGEEEENKNSTLTIEPSDEKEDTSILSSKGNEKEKKSPTANFETNEEGIFIYTAMPNKTYKIIAKKEGYDNQEMEISYLDLKKEKEFCLPMNKYSCKTMTTKVINKKSNSAMPLAEVEVWNKSNNQKDKYTTDETGAFEICVPCDCEFSIYATSHGFDSATEILSKLENKCDSKNNLEVKLELDLSKTEPIKIAKSTPVATVPVTTFKEVTAYVPITDLVNNENANISEGQVISLKDIYYNFDKSDIRIDASADLNHILSLLQKHPSMEIELMSHTDSRGTKEYNMSLSSERAKSARQFLIKKGIAAQRVTAAGYGELQLQNKCADGITCTETEHQQNRRTEVKVTKM